MNCCWNPYCEISHHSGAKKNKRQTYNLKLILKTFVHDLLATRFSDT